MTIDNVVMQVLYKGRPIRVHGHLRNWRAHKTFSFYKEAGGELEITGWNAENRVGCSWAGLLLACDDGLISNANNWKAFGSNVRRRLPKRYYSKPCVSRSPFGTSYFRTTKAQKIWPRNGANYAWFSVIP